MIENQTFSYGFFYKMIYRYGNILATILLVLYLIPNVQNVEKDSTQYFYAVAIALIIVFINIYFVRLYKIVPFKIEYKDDVLICSDFTFSSKQVTIPLKDINKLSGGIFDGKPSGIMKVENTEKEIKIGFFHKITNAKMLESLILSKIKKELYDDVLGKLGIRRDKIRKKANK